MKKIVKTVVDEYSDGQLVKKTETTEEFDDKYLTVPYYPNTPYNPYNPLNPNITYKTYVGDVIPNPYETTTCKSNSPNDYNVLVNFDTNNVQDFINQLVKIKNTNKF